MRLGDTFNSTNDAAAKIIPVETVCNYWEYWFTFLTEHITQADNTGFSQRVQLVGTPGVTTPPDFPENPLDNTSGLQANGKFSQLSPTPGVFDPRTQPILHGNPYVDYGSKDAPNCQNGQTGYPLGEALVNGQAYNNPTFGVQDVTKAAGMAPLGKTDLFLEQDGKRIFWDSANNPSG